MRLKQVITDNFRLLTFRLTGAEMQNLGRPHLLFGLVVTWIVGIGRYWDNPRAEFLQHLGIGSIVYVFLLALLLTVVVRPLTKADWSYLKVLTFLTLVSPPAVIYAIPVQFWFDIETSNIINAWFLFIVAVWRLSLLIFFLRRFAKLNYAEVLVSAFLPVTLLVFVLTLLNLEKAVFEIMGGLNPGTPNDDAYLVLNLISLLSFFLFPILLVAYIILIILKKMKNDKITE